MGYAARLCYILVILVSLAKAQNTPGASRIRNEKDRLRCLGVQCPPERPRCIADVQGAKCVASEPVRTVSSRDLRNNRLSRPAPGFGSSQRQPSRPSQTFQLNEAVGSISHRDRSSKPITAGGVQKIPDNVPSYCHERFQTGLCRAYFPRYYYNKDTGRCHRFVFGGCGGNQNNFKTEQACKSTCLEPIANSGFNVGLDANYPTPNTNSNANNPTGTSVNNGPTQVNSGFAKGAPPPQPSRCRQNPERGPCTSMMPRYYYNKQTGECRSFRFGGCGGNRNNFRSMTQCKRACDYADVYVSRQSNGRNIPQGPEADVLPSDIPIEKFNEETKPSVSSSSTPSSDNPFISSQTNGSPQDNPFISSQTNGSPQDNPFISSQINGSPQDNPFIPSQTNGSPQGTSGFAKGAPPPMPQYCFQTPERGPCFAVMPRYYYNKEVGQCRSFAYGGCGGNQNNFKSMAACKLSCDYIDAFTSRQSNGNNIPQDQAADVVFATTAPEIVTIIPEIAVTTTTTPSPVPEYCLLPKKVGPCRALMPRFFYNSKTGRCEQFGFGGCQPNENNFKSERECKRLCVASSKAAEVEKISGNNLNIHGERNTMRHGQLRQFNPVDSRAFREYLMNQQVNNDIDIVGPSVPGFHVCAQRMDPGTCNLEIRSYYFSASTRTCQPFIFRGCGGNQNRFRSLQACYDMCINDSLLPARIP